jgi:hypothetical protein
MLVGISHHPGDTFQLSNLFRGALGVTAGHQNSALGIPSVDSPNDLAHLGVRGGRDGTGVQNCYGTIFQVRSFLKPSVKQLLLQRGAVGLAGAATKIEDVERCHGQIATLCPLHQRR